MAKKLRRKPLTLTLEDKEMISSILKPVRSIKNAEREAKTRARILSYYSNGLKIQDVARKAHVSVPTACKYVDTALDKGCQAAIFKNQKMIRLMNSQKIYDTNIMHQLKSEEIKTHSHNIRYYLDKIKNTFFN